MDIKEIFLKLTEYTIPHGKEDRLAKYLPEGIQKDEVGNYFIKIGESKTMFCTHLDTYCKKLVKVVHMIDGDKIKTNGKTILGGDNKLGCSILLYMIEKQVPGLYYFFIGEEPIHKNGGRYGSKTILKANDKIFEGYKRCIAFDRRETGSLVTRQLGRRCCSDEFGNLLKEQLKQNGLEYELDDKAYYTDTATFIDYIPECTNLSAGGWGEHTHSEWVDLSYTKLVAEAAVRINWEELKVNRIIPNYRELKKTLNKEQYNSYTKIGQIISKYNVMIANSLEYIHGISNEIKLSTWFDDIDLSLQIVDKYLILNGEKTNFSGLDRELKKKFGPVISKDEFDIISEDNKLFAVIQGETHEINFYFDHFFKINPGNTSYKFDKGGSQFCDISGMTLEKNDIFNYVKQRLNIE